MTQNERKLLAEICAACQYDPQKWAEAAFPWGKGELKKHDGPRVWQSDINNIISAHLKNENTRHKPLKIAVASGHGIGKSAEIGLLANWAMSCHAGARMVVTANTDTQLRTKTAPEVSKWFNLSLTKDLFKKPAMSIYNQDDEKNWRLDFTPWSENNTEAFAGLHNEGKIIVLVMDEASGIADKIWEVAEGALTDEDTIIIWIAFGNPTRETGRFRECFRKHKHRWVTRHIDSRTVEGVNKEHLNQMVEDYGENSDYIKVRVRGMFPSQALRQLIPTNLVDEAFGRHLKPEQYEFAPSILVCDPAWEGDDKLIIAHRKGLMFEVLEEMPKNNNDVLVANKLAMYEDRLKADAVIIDGGYGTGIVSAGRTMNRDWQIVFFSEAAPDKGYLNIRAYGWSKIIDWLRDGGALPPDQEIYDELIAPEIIPRLDGKVHLEAKKDMKKRGLPSPNKADTLAMSFMRNVSKRGIGGQNASLRVTSDYDPYSNF